MSAGPVHATEKTKNWTGPDQLVGIKSPVHRTKKKPDWDQTGPEKTRLSVAVQPFHEKENRKKTDETEPVWTGLARLKLDLCSPCKYASFATILKKNGQELHVLQPKRYITVKSNLHNNL